LDVEERAGLALDEENLNQQFHDEDIDQADGLRSDRSRSNVTNQEGGDFYDNAHNRGNSRASGWPRMDDEADDDVPASLLVEYHDNDPPLPIETRRQAHRRPAPVPGPSTRRSRAQWEAAQQQQRLHRDEGNGANQRRKPGSLIANKIRGDAREKAMWRWVNVSNLDHFMTEVYEYYQGAGIWCILLGRALHLV
jgi:autophagy-related protein 9